MVELIVTELGLGRESSSSINSTKIGQKTLNTSTSMSKFDSLSTSQPLSQGVSAFFLRSINLQIMFIPILFCIDFYIETPKNVELFETFSHFGGTELNWNGTSYFCHNWN